MKCEECKFPKKTGKPCIIALLAAQNKKLNADREAYSCPINYIAVEMM